MHQRDCRCSRRCAFPNLHGQQADLKNLSPVEPTEKHLAEEGRLCAHQNIRCTDSSIDLKLVTGDINLRTKMPYFYWSYGNQHTIEVTGKSRYINQYNSRYMNYGNDMNYIDRSELSTNWFLPRQISKHLCNLPELQLQLLRLRHMWKPPSAFQPKPYPKILSSTVCLKIQVLGE